MQNSSIGQLSTLFSDVTRWWRNLWGNRTGISELDKLDWDEMKHIARDVGTSTEELQALAGKWPDSADLLTRRMATPARSIGNCTLAARRVERP
jgi:hypothetical protein